MKNTSYAEKLKDPRWTRKKNEVLTRDDFTCLDCRSTTDALNVHHVHYRKGNPWDTENDLLMTLCEECHKKRGALEDRGKVALARIFRRLPCGELANYDLDTFVADLEKAAAMDDRGEYAPTVLDGYDVEWESDARWFRYAWDNPSFREIYEIITGRSIKWPEKGKDA